MNKLSNLEFVILMLTSENPVHGYQIEQMIEKRGLRTWTDIGFSSIYHVLGKLQKASFLKSRSEASGNLPARRYFSITPAGMKLLKTETLSRLSTPHPASADFDLAISALPVLTPDEIRQALMEYRKRLGIQIKEVAKKEKEQTGFLPPHVFTLFDHNLHTMRSEADWIDTYLKRMEHI